MNEHDPLETMLDQFRETMSPNEVRDSNREAVQTALEHRVSTHWWQRSIKVPLPLALASAAVLLVSLSTHLIGVQERGELIEPNIEIKPSSGRDTPAATLAASTGHRVEYSETQSYLSGIGVIDRNIFYRIKE